MQTPVPREYLSVSENGQGRYQQTIRAGHHVLTADEPVSGGGDGAGPSPHDLLLAGLGACTAITLRMYAERKEWPLRHIHVELSHEKAEIEGGGRIDRITRNITLKGELAPDQRNRLLEIANKCPMCRLLSSATLIDTALVE